MTRQILNRRFLTTFFFTLLLTYMLQAQGTQSLWTEADRQYTLDNMRRTRDELVKETENLTPAQWAFQDSVNRWSIGEVVEHLALWEIIWAREIGMGCRNKPQPELNATSSPDSYYTTFIMEDKPHTAPDFAVPTGFITGKDNLTFFLRGREQAIKFVETTKYDLRAQFELTNTQYPRNMHQVLIYQWGHVDRHLKQIRKLKGHKDYPKSNEMDRSVDEKAIMATIQKETDCFYARDYNGWKETYVQEKYTHQGWSNPDGTFDIRVGWDNVNSGIEKYIKENILPAKEKRRVERKDIQYTFYGDNVCYLTWEQYQIYSAEKTFHHSHEIRIMEKRNGQWKIASQAAFWDYKNLVPVTEFKP